MLDETPGKHSAVIFDMDGLLLDTERPALRAFEEACAHLKIELDRSVYLQCIGTNAAGTRRILTEALGQESLFLELSRVWNEKYSHVKLAEPAPLKEGAVDLLSFVKEAGARAGLATSTAYDSATNKLRLAGVFHYFDVIIAGDDVSEGKPHPEIYLKAANASNVPARSCFAIEDSDNGVRSAHAAGMTVIQVPDMVEPAEDVRALGHLVLRSLREVRQHLILG